MSDDELAKASKGTVRTDGRGQDPFLFHALEGTEYRTKISTLRGYEKDGSMRHISILCGNNALFLDFEMERGADGANTGYCFPDMLVDVVRLSSEGKRDEAHDLFDAHLPLIRYEQQPGPGLAVRKYVMMKRGILSHDTLRKPGAALSAVARAEVDYLLSRVARVDARARV